MLLQSPQTSVVEALLFSAKLRLNGDIDHETIEAYVDEVMDLVELTSIKGAIVSPSSACLSCSDTSKDRKEHVGPVEKCTAFARMCDYTPHRASGRHSTKLSLWMQLVALNAASCPQIQCKPLSVRHW